MSALELRGLRNIEVNRRSQREVDKELAEAKKRALIAAGKMVLNAELDDLEDALDDRKAESAIRRTDHNVALGGYVARRNPPAENLVRDIIVALHNKRVDRLGRRLQ